MTTDSTPLQERIERELEEMFDGGGFSARDMARDLTPIIAAEVQAAAEHRATRAEAQSAIRGRAVVMYRERAREAEARIEAVRDVHTGTAWPGIADKPICDACDQPCPCPTIRAMEG